jgi:Family of unknown function (DUF6535)
MSFSQEKTMHDFKPAAQSGEDIQSVFWAKYNEAATKYDNEFLKSHNKDLDVILIFVSRLYLFSYALTQRDSLVFSLPSILHSFWPALKGLTLGIQQMPYWRSSFWVMQVALMRQLGCFQIGR